MVLVDASSGILELGLVWHIASEAVALRVGSSSESAKSGFKSSWGGYGSMIEWSAEEAGEVSAYF